MNRTKQLNQIAKAIREFYKTLKNEFNAILELEEFTNGEFLLLKSIALFGHKKISEIAKELCVSMPYLTSFSSNLHLTSPINVTHSIPQIKSLKQKWIVFLS